MSDFNFNDKRVVVTGGATGVGAALLDLLAELGARDVTVLDIKQPTGPHKIFLQADLSDRASLDAAIGQIKAPVDVLYNNAGVADTSPRERVIAVNILAPIHLTNALLPQIPSGGAIVNTASIAGMAWSKRLDSIQELLLRDQWDDMGAWFRDRELGVDTYSFTKEALQVWTMQSAAALTPRGIRINGVCPAPIDTPLVGDFRKTIGEAGMDFTIKHAGGRMVSAREVASLLAYLGSEAASFVSGQNVNIDFGFQASMITGALDTSSVRASAGRV